MDYLDYGYFERRLGEITALLARVLARLDLLSQEGEIMSAELDALQRAVTNCTTVGDSAVTLMKGLAAQIAALKTDPAALQALADRLDAEAATWKTAVEANTPATTTPAPAGPTPPTPAPPTTTPPGPAPTPAPPPPQATAPPRRP